MKEGMTGAGGVGPTRLSAPKPILASSSADAGVLRLGAWGPSTCRGIALGIGPRESFLAGLRRRRGVVCF